MDIEGYRELQLLTEISSGESVTQRGLAKRYRLALGLINFLMRRLVKKGYVKITNLQRKRLRYLITPNGVAEKARLTYEYLEYSLFFYRQLRAVLTRALTVIVESGGKNTVLYGADEVSEVAFLLLQQHGIHVVAVIDESSSGRSPFINLPVKRFEELSTLEFDWIVVASVKDADRMVARLCEAGVPGDKIIAITNHGSLLGAPQAIISDADAVDAVEIK